MFVFKVKNMSLYSLSTEFYEEHVHTVCLPVLFYDDDFSIQIVGVIIICKYGSSDRNEVWKTIA
jgi:hypothetical protein